MIDPQRQWAIQIDVTNACTRACSNCTRLVGHGPTFDMRLEQVRAALVAVRTFPTDSPAAEHVPFKLVGIIGGEPLLHPKFPEICEEMTRYLPKEHRGLWTGLRWQASKHADIICETFSERGIHNNRHDTPCRHSPVLVACSDAIGDQEERAAV